MREFNLEEALAGAPVCIRDGRPVTQLMKFDISDSERFEIPASVRLAGVIPGYNLCTWAADGRFYGDCCSHFDLVMAPVKKTGWVARYKYHTGGSYIGHKSDGRVYEAEEFAKGANPEALSYHQIEWEE